VNGPEAVAKVDAEIAEPAVDHCLSVLVRDTQWYHLQHLVAQAPDLAAKRWEEVQEEAHAELMTGHRAAQAVERGNTSCFERAQFLAIRDSLAADWRPRTGVEWALIDTMAQDMTLQMFWTQRLVILDALEWPDPPSKEMAKCQPPQLGQSMAIDQAAGMVDRFNRMFMRTLRQLRDLRRYTVVIQSADQVNIGQQQVNVATAPEDTSLPGPDTVEREIIRLHNDERMDDEGAIARATSKTTGQKVTVAKVKRVIEVYAENPEAFEQEVG
jgi:hypothetical protein